MLVVEAHSYWSFLLAKLEIPSQVIDILANFTFWSQFDRSWIFYAISALLNKHGLEDVGG